jgi:microcystin-dependent protein
MMPPHAHPASQAAHTHPGSYQDGHTHPGSYQDAHTHADTGHVHGASASQDAHNHTVSTIVFSGSGATPGGASWSVGSATTSTTQPAVHIAINTDYAHLDNRQPAVHIDTQQPAVHIDTQTPAVTVGNAGGGSAHENRPPFLAINFIVRYI